MPRKKQTGESAGVIEKTASLLDAVIEKTDELITKIVTVNRDRLMRNANYVDVYGKDQAQKFVHFIGPIEIQVFRKGKKTVLITAMSMKIDGQCEVQYDPEKFVAPYGCGDAISTPKAVWIETTGRVTYTDKQGGSHVI